MGLVGEVWDREGVSGWGRWPGMGVLVRWMSLALFIARDFNTFSKEITEHEL